MSEDRKQTNGNIRTADRRNLRLKNKREAVRIVRNTFIFIALLAGCWYLYLVYKDSQKEITPESLNKQEIREAAPREIPGPPLGDEGKKE
ncbi:MAG: hypothetical protein Q4G69_04675 [Planctomycetia bacterium]|nr:hypothetical protein [Planctomycetia bacterium]